MTASPPTTRRPRRRLRAFLRDQRGLSAIEFAFIAPILILIYMGLGELTLAMMAERRASHAASAVGDLIAQAASSVTLAEVDQALDIGKAVVSPYATTGLSMRVSSIKADSNAIPKVVWSRAQGTQLTKLTAGATANPFPANLLDKDESVIKADVIYTFDTPLKKIVTRQLRFSETFYLRPRRADEITCGNCP